MPCGRLSLHATCLHSRRGEPDGARQIASAVIVQSWARVLLARAALGAERRGVRAAALQASVEDKSANRIQSAFLAKKAEAARFPSGGSTGTLLQQEEATAAIIVQSWARVLLAKIAVYHEERKFRLLAFFTHIEDKHAANIQRRGRSHMSRPVGLPASGGGGRGRAGPPPRRAAGC